ncbi:uncharacterized protein LOC128162266 [Crassostrea angulata]|uniref:uncharacterized protein LOC128162266 n=1 Tax=Magallana angulata TaxID=2784310 RepID=UPI0022B085A9|nr:uncharacterized protein LOC128162266 [Crassostrea angulata]
MENTVIFRIAFLIVFQLVVPVSLLFCNGIDGELVCCDGYKFIPEQNNCTLCDKGFRGKNCNTKCPYHTYGEECQYICKCNITHCNHVNGCTEASEEQFSKHINYKTVTKDLINGDNLDKSSSGVTVENTTNFFNPKRHKGVPL